MNPFRMYGRTVQIYRYKAEYIEPLAPESEPEPITGYYPTLEEAHAASGEEGIITEMDTSKYEWLDGLEVPDVEDTYAEAVSIYNMGQAEYERMQAFEESKKAAQLRADLDYVMLMEGL